MNSYINLTLKDMPYHFVKFQLTDNTKLFYTINI